MKIIVNPLAELIYCILNSTNRFSVNIIYILQGGHRTNFIDYSGKQTACAFCIVYESESAHYVMEKTITNEKQVKEGLVMRKIKLDDFFKMF